MFKSESDARIVTWKCSFLKGTFRLSVVAKPLKGVMDGMGNLED